MKMLTRLANCRLPAPTVRPCTLAGHGRPTGRGPNKPRGKVDAGPRTACSGVEAFNLRSIRSAVGAPATTWPMLEPRRHPLGVRQVRPRERGTPNAKPALEVSSTTTVSNYTSVAPWRRLRPALAFAIVTAANPAWGLGHVPLVTHDPSPGAFALVSAGKAAPLFADDNDLAGVLRAARDLQADIERVTGRAPKLDVSGKPEGTNVVIVGTLGRSKLIDALVRAGKLDTSGIAGRWEAFRIEVVTAPLPGIERALVIAGSDKRGTIFGIYELSEQIGVSPWYWWADVPVDHREALFVRPGSVLEEAPVVQYRGIFLNDEAPALSGWAQEKFGGFNHKFYTKLFELILRLRGNYLWPAMWGSAFNDDDSRNPELAEEYGIVMGTSHHEPLMRAHDEWRRYGSGPWNYATNAEALRKFWREGMQRVRDFEQIVSIGMRGDGDEAMSEETNVALLERVVAGQREILREVSGRELKDVPQLWALYKEVQDYYENGMRVPDDVILLWCDDNWGNIRRLPTPEERKRSGGAGVYYHFDYVGGPRNYKWLNTVPLTKIWEQMHLAWRHEAKRIWIVNVDDLKPMEFPTEFFLAMAWDPARWTCEGLDDYSRAWAAREFGEEHAAEVAALINGYTKLNSRRKPEMLAPDTYSLVNYREAERVLAEWRDLTTRAERLNSRLPQEARDAFFQLVLYPVKASAVVHELHVSAGLNNLYVRQGRAAANTQAARARELLAEDGALADAYHKLGGGRWNHMMAQINLGYTIWQQPDIESMPAVQEVRPRPGAAMAIAIEGSERAYPSSGAGPAVLPPLDTYRRGTRWIEVFNRGGETFTYKVTADQSWVTLAPASGSVEEITRIEVGADWKAVPPGETSVTVVIEGSTGERRTVQLPVRNPKVPKPADVKGFVETDGHVAVEAPHFHRSVTDREIEWKTLADFGPTLGGVTAFPVLAAPRQPGGGSPRLEYDVHLFSSGEVTVELHCAPSLNIQSGEGLRLAVSFDNAPPQILKLDTWSTLQTWERAVSDGVRRVTSRHHIEQPGHHVLKFWMVTPGVVLARVIVDTGGIRPSYLGPPESFRGE